MNNLVTFQSLDLGERFFFPDLAEDYAKHSSTTAEILIGGNYYTGEIVVFDNDSLVLVY
jgi:hypothetical protein